MTVLLLTALLVLWAAGMLLAVGLCVIAARTDRADASRARGLVPLRLVSR
jgi:hypothetical protein